MKCVVCLLVNGGNESMADRAVTVMDGNALCAGHLEAAAGKLAYSDRLADAVMSAHLARKRVMR